MKCMARVYVINLLRPFDTSKTLKKVLGFIFNEGGHITDTGISYLYHFPYYYYNVSI